MNKVKPKDLRNRLFKENRTNIRSLEMSDIKGSPKDIKILWAAYKNKSFPQIQDNLNEDEFLSYFNTILSSYSNGWISEDVNSSFGSGYGPVGLILSLSNEWEIEPVFFDFFWSSKKNKIKNYVSFLQMMRYDKSVGIVNISTTDEKTTKLLKKLQKYGVINYTGFIPKGHITGDRHIFYVRGKKRFIRNSEQSEQNNTERI